ncbi:MAG TPA: glycosyltransferase family 2 protein [Gemmataceae bacterium]|nr:glycosyltransferase family 2 protein [Gemmataceae bacterium]
MALALPAQERALPRPARPPLWHGLRNTGQVLRIPQVSVVIVNYCLWKETGRLVRQLSAAPCVRRGAAEVVVVDNHSPTHALAKRLRRWPGVSLRRWERNRGFAQAVNEGCRLSQGKWLLLLNPDISVSPDFLDGVLALTERLSIEEPDAGIVGFELRNSDGSCQLSSGPFPTLLQTLARLALPRTRRKYHLLPLRRRCRVPWVTGCCLLLRRECLNQLGGMDGDFFLYYEDVDLCRRAADLGWSVCFEPTLQAIHHHPLHLRAIPAYMRLLTRHALLTYASKHWPPWQFRLLAHLVQWEARVRQYGASRRNDPAAAQLFGQLRAIALDLGLSRQRSAQRRLQQVIRREEQRRAS